MARWKLYGNRAARNEVVEHYLCLAVSLVYQMAGRGAHTEELISAANYGLLRAADRFDHTRGVRFGSYARAFIRGHILRALRSRSKHAGVPMENDENEEGAVAAGETAVQLPPEPITIDASVDAPKIAAAIKRLDRRSRAVIKAVYWQRMNFAQVARKLNCSREWVRKVHDLAALQLREALPQ